MKTQTAFAILALSASLSSATAETGKPPVEAAGKFIGATAHAASNVHLTVQWIVGFRNVTACPYSTSTADKTYPTRALKCQSIDAPDGIDKTDPFVVGGGYNPSNVAVSHAYFHKTEGNILKTLLCTAIVSHEGVVNLSCI